MMLVIDTLENAAVVTDVELVAELRKLVAVTETTRGYVNEPVNVAVPTPEEDGVAETPPTV
jgi:hypothetical protein